MGGTIWAESASAGQGSCFNLTLKAPPAELTATARRQFGGEQPMLKGRRLLVVDDNATNRRVLSLQAAKWGMVVEAAPGGEEALALVDAGAVFDLVITDMHMPGMDGVAFARQLLQRRPRWPRVLSTSVGWREADHAGTREADTGDETLFTATLVKPLHQSQLFDTLATLLGSSQRRTRPPPAANAGSVDAPLARRHPLRILVAEDNLVNQKLALLLLQQMGYRADVAGNGIEVIDSLQRQPYDLVLMDVQMPEMDGLEATRRIVARWPGGERPRIVAMTANAMQGDREQCLAAGMDDYLTKPIRMEALARALAQSPSHAGSS